MAARLTPLGRRVGSSTMGDPTEVSDEIPTGLPPDQPEEPPLGVPDGEDAPDRGPKAMPGIPTDGEPPAAS
jgi:hypothetical protein